MKQWTTPTIAITLTDENAAEILERARNVVVTAKGNKQLSEDYSTKDGTASVSGSTVSCTMTQEDTGRIGGKGDVEFEITIVTEDGRVAKSVTVLESIGKAVRNKVIDDE